MHKRSQITLIIILGIIIFLAFFLTYAAVATVQQQELSQGVQQALESAVSL